MRYAWRLAVVCGALGYAPSLTAAPETTIVREDLLRQAGLSNYWHATLPFWRGDSTAAAYLIDDNLYVVTRRGDVHVVNPTVGLLRWSHSITERGGKVFKPTHFVTDDGRPAVAMTYPDGVFIFERSTGLELAEVSELWTAGSAAVGHGNLLFAGSTDGYVYAIQWHDPLSGKPFRRWKVLVDGAVTAAPVVSDGLLYMASQSGSVYACTADTYKEFVWQYDTEGAVLADLLVDESGVYVADQDRSLYRLDPATGELRWRYRLPRPLRAAPLVAQRTVYQACPGEGLYAIDIDARVERWHLPSVIGFLSRRADQTCVLLPDHRVAVMNSHAGTLRHTVTFPPGAIFVANPNALTFYVVTHDGVVGCITSKERGQLRLDALLRRGLAPASQPQTPPKQPEKPATAPAKEQTDEEDAAAPTTGQDLNDPLRSRLDR